MPGVCLKLDLFCSYVFHFCLSGAAVLEDKEKKNALFPSWWSILTGL